jgi:hypothetical protein
MKWIRFWRRCPTKLFALRFRFFWFGNSDKFIFLADSHLEPHFNNRKIKPATWNGWMLSRILDEGIASRLPAFFIRGTISRKTLISSTLRLCSHGLWRSQRGTTYHDQPCSIAGIQPQHASRDSSFLMASHGTFFCGKDQHVSCGTQKFNGT